MITLLVVIYIIFISLGLPDSLFGVAWPVLHIEFGIPENFASFYSIIIGCCTGGVSIFSGFFIRKFGTSKVTIVSILLTIIGMLGISFSPNIIVMMLFAVILGWGAGAIDSGLNNFVSLHYKAIHMNFLHAFWGIGVTLSPIIMSFFLGGDNPEWRNGYRAIVIIQTVIFFIALMSLKRWTEVEKNDSVQEPQQVEEVKKDKNIFQILSIKGVIFGILSLGFYCSMEFLLGTWGASFLVNVYDFGADTAAKWVSLYYGGIMLGRIVSGLVSLKIKSKNLVRFGILFSLVGMILLMLPIGELAITGLLLIGFGFGPVFPNVLHLIPERFGKKYSPDITGFHMGGAYLIGFSAQLTYGFVATATTFKITPYVIIVILGLLFIANELANKKSKLNKIDE